MKAAADAVKPPQQAVWQDLVSKGVGGALAEQTRRRRTCLQDPLRANSASEALMFPQGLRL
jgi:hypothetical protein